MTPVPFVVRRLAPEEAPILREFLYLAIFLPPGAPPPPRSVVDHPALIGYIDSFGSRPGDHCLVAETAGQVVGAAWTRIAKDCGHGKENTSCLAISLLPGYRGRGIGTKLLAELLSLLEEEGISQVTLSVQRANPARHLYERAGFEIVAERDSDNLMLRNLSQAAKRKDGTMEQRMQKEREEKIRQWFAMWCQKQRTDLKELFSSNAVYIESWGPEYHGREKILLWFDEWNTRGTVQHWRIQQYFHKENQTIAAWSFRCVLANGTVQSFDGLSLVRWDEEEKICYLQEFGCHEDRYDPYAQGPMPVFRQEQAPWF